MVEPGSLEPLLLRSVCASQPLELLRAERSLRAAVCRAHYNFIFLVIKPPVRTFLCYDEVGSPEPREARKCKQPITIR